MNEWRKWAELNASEQPRKAVQRGCIGQGGILCPICGDEHANLPVEVRDGRVLLNLHGHVYEVQSTAIGEFLRPISEAS